MANGKMVESDEGHVELSAKKIEQLRKQPIIESIILKSEDGKWVIHKMVITEI